MYPSPADGSIGRSRWSDPAGSSEGNGHISRLHCPMRWFPNAHGNGGNAGDISPPAHVPPRQATDDVTRERHVSHIGDKIVASSAFGSVYTIRALVLERVTCDAEYIPGV